MAEEDLSSLSVEQLQDKLYSDPTVGKPEWGMESIPEQARMQDFLATHARAGKTWQETRAHMQDRFPEAVPYKHQEMFEQMGMGLKLEEAKKSYEGREETGGSWFMRRGIPFVSTVKNVNAKREYGAAVQRINDRKPNPEDYDTIANYERVQELDKKGSETWGGAIGSAATHIPALVGEVATGGIVLRGLGVGASAAAQVGAQSAKVAVPIFSRAALQAGLEAAPGAIARTAAQTALVPSMYAEKWVQNNIDAKRDPMSIKGFPSAFGLGMLQTAILGSMQKWASAALPGEGVANFLGRQGLKGGIGTAESAAADVLAGVTHLQTGYGTLGEILQDVKEQKYGAALRTATVQALTFTAFGTIHEGMHGTPGMQREALKPYLETLQQMRARGLSPEAAGKAMSVVGDRLVELLKTNPEPSREDVARAMEGVTGPAKQWADVLANTLPIPEQHEPFDPKAQQAATHTDVEAAKSALPPAVQQSLPPEAPAAPQASAQPQQAAALAQPVPQARAEPKTAREQATALEAEHSSALKALMDAKNVEAREIASQGMGLANSAKAAKEKRQAAQKELKRVEAEWEKARNQAAMEEIKAKPAEPAPEKIPLSSEVSDRAALEGKESADGLPPRAEPRDEPERQHMDAEVRRLMGLPLEPEESSPRSSRQLGMKDRTPPPEPKPSEPPRPEPALPAHEQVFKAVFPDGKMTPRGEFEAKVGDKTVYLGHDPDTNTVRIDFEGAKSGVPQKLQAHSLELARRLRQLIQGLADAGTGISYRAIDSNRAQGKGEHFATERADLYARQLEKAGYEQVSAEKGMFTWKPSLDKMEAQARQGNPPTLESTLEAAGLDARQRHIIDQRLLQRTHDDIAGDKELLKKGGGKLTRARIQQIEKDACAKLGIGSIEELVNKWQRGSGKVEQVASSQLTPDQVSVEKGELAHQVSAEQLEENRQQAWFAYIEKEAEKHGGNLPAERRAALTRDWLQGGLPPTEAAESGELPAPADAGGSGDRGQAPVEAQGGQAPEAAQPAAEANAADAGEAAGHPPAEPSAVAAARQRYEGREKTAGGGGLFGGEDLQARRGFARLPDGAQVLFVAGELEGQVGRIGTENGRKGAYVEGRPGLVAVGPDAVEPLSSAQSWRTSASTKPVEQQSLLTAATFLPKGKERWTQEATDAGVEPERLHSQAAEHLTQNNEAVKDHNDVLKEARKALAKFGGAVKSLRSERYEDSSEVPGIDEVAGDLAKRWPDLFPADTNPSDTLFGMLKEGNRKSMTKDHAYDLALRDLTNEKEVENAKEEARRSGLSESSREEIIRGGEEAADAAQPDETERSETGDASFDPVEFGEVGKPSVLENLKKAAKKFGSEEKASLDLDKLSEGARQVWDWVKRMTTQKAGSRPHITKAVIEKARDAMEVAKEDLSFDVFPDTIEGQDFQEPGWYQDTDSGGGWTLWLSADEVAATLRMEAKDTSVGEFIGEHHSVEFQGKSNAKVIKQIEGHIDGLLESATRRPEQFTDENGNPVDFPEMQFERGSSPQLEQQATGIAKFLADEGGFLDTQAIGKFAAGLKDRIVSAVKRLGMELKELAGRQAPRTTAHSPEAGEAITRFNAADTFTKAATVDMITKIMGKDAAPEDRVPLGSTFQETRHRLARLNHFKKSRESSNAAAEYRARAEVEMDQTKRAQLLQAAADEARRATEYMHKGQHVVSFIGKEGYELPTEEVYQQLAASEKMKQVWANWKEFMVPLMEENFMKAEGLSDAEDIHSSTQIPGLPMNAKAIRGEELARRGGGRGNLKNPKQRQYEFANEAGLDGEYDTDLGHIIENSMRAYKGAMKAEMYRTLERTGLARWGRSGQQIEVDGVQLKEVPGVNPKRGTQNAEPGESSLYLHPDAYNEVRRALQVDQPMEAGSLKAFNDMMTKTALASTVEMASHSKNLLTFLFKPGVNPLDIFREGRKVMKQDPETMSRLTELARIGAAKVEKGFESEQGMKEGSWSKYNPLHYGARVLDFLQQTMRLVAENAYDRLEKAGRIEASETGKRDFINQLGQYNKASQQKYVAWLRDTGFGPFATAATNYWMQGLYALVGAPGVKGKTGAQAFGMHAEVLGRMALVAGTAALINHLAHGRVDGSDDTPLGAIKVEEVNGKTVYFDLTNLIGLTRGMRQTGLLALAEGVRSGKTPGQITDRAVKQVGQAALHPAEGPAVSFLHTALTGENTIGMPLAKKALPGQSQSWENLAAALSNANPAISTLFELDNLRGEKREISRAWKLLGPFGLREKGKGDKEPPTDDQIEEKRLRRQLGAELKRK